VTSLGSGSATWGPTLGLTASLGLDPWNGHKTDAARLDWGADGNDLHVVWRLEDAEGDALPGVGALGVSSTHLSLRVGNIAEGDETCDENEVELQFDEVEGDVRLLFENTSGLEQTTAWHSIGLVVDPQRHSQYNQSTTELQCDAIQFMHTVRLPLTDFCDEGKVSIGNLVGIELRLFDKGIAQHLLVDSIEFTTDPTDVQTPKCPMPTSAWDCMVAGAFAAIETSCTVEPSPQCPSGSSVVTAVSAPWVDNPGGNGFNGWVAHAPAGWIVDPNNPTSAELDDIVDACMEACELEWSDNPDIAATCDAQTFASVSLRSSPDRGSVQRIPTSQEQGGFFGGQQLGCNLEGDCCLGFDEDLCRARPSRPTSARAAVGAGEEYRVSIGSGSQVAFVTPGGAFTSPLTGTVGYTQCPAGATGTTCPFYLGSATVTATSSVTVTDVCPDGSSFLAVVDDLDIELLQPAFGLADANSYQKAMPVGSLLMQGTITVDGSMYTIHATNEEVVYLTSLDGSLFALDMDIGFDAPCGDSTLPVTVEFDLYKGSLLESPPTISITVPGSVQCPSSVPLTSTASDPDNDIASIRWYVDDVLLSPSTTAIQFSTAHVLRVVVRDARGATTSATQTISCR